MKQRLSVTPSSIGQIPTAGGIVSPPWQAAADNLVAEVVSPSTINQ
jgi:hypothetical protein